MRMIVELSQTESDGFIAADRSDLTRATSAQDELIKSKDAILLLKLTQLKHKAHTGPIGNCSLYSTSASFQYIT